MCARPSVAVDCPLAHGTFGEVNNLDFTRPPRESRHPRHQIERVGYVATDLALDEGSYETRLCRHVRAPKGTGKRWADTAIKGLESLK